MYICVFTQEANEQSCCWVDCSVNVSFYESRRAGERERVRETMNFPLSLPGFFYFIFHFFPLLPLFSVSFSFFLSFFLLLFSHCFGNQQCELDKRCEWEPHHFYCNVKGGPAVCARLGSEDACHTHKHCIWDARRMHCHAEG